ncbi:MAG: TonB-dependent receptor, partial [Gammaproteobacteria bacterium]
TKSENKNQDYNDYVIQNLTTSSKDQVNFLSSYFWQNSSQRSSLLLEHEKEEFTQNGIIYDYGIYGIFDPNQQRKKSSSSIAIEHRGNINDNISYAASARHDENSQFKDGNTSRFELVYTFSNNFRARSAYGSAVKNPTFTERFGYYTNFIGNPNLQPEKSKNFELGVDFKLNKNYSFSATFFKSKLENEINGNTIDSSTSGYTAKNIDGLSKRQGIELSSAIPLNENLRINASYTYTDSIQFEDNRYVDEVRRPKSTASATIQWKSNKNSLFNLNVRYTDKQIDVVYPGYVMMPSYTVLNFGAKFSLNQKLSLKISLNNLLNEDYEELYGYSALGLSANIGMQYKF